MNIDITKIDGYAEMSAEEKVKALETFEFTDYSSEVDKLKQIVSKANTEAADWKRKHNALLTEDERKEAERQEAFSVMQEKLKEYEIRDAINESTTKFLALGYDEENAKKSAKALNEGDFDSVLSIQKAFLDEQEKKIKADLLSNTKRPQTGGSTVAPMTKEQIMAIKDSAERQKAIAENINLFK